MKKKNKIVKDKPSLIFFPDLPPSHKRNDPLSIHKRKTERLLKIFGMWPIK